MADVTATVRTVIAVVDQATGPLRAIQGQFQKFTAPLQGMVAKVKGLGDTTGLSKLGGAFKSAAGMAGGFASSLLSVAAPLAGITGAAGLGGLVAGLHSFVEEGDRLDDTAHKVGVTVEALQALELWGAKSDVAADQMASSIGKLTKKVGEAASGNKKSAELFADLGIAISDANGKTRDIMQILPDLSRAMQKIDDPAKRAALASQVFGKAWQGMLPLLMQGPEGLAQAVAEMEKVGIITGKQAEQAGKLADAQLLLQKSIGGVRNAISATLVPVILPLVEGLTTWIQTNRELVATTITEWLAKVGTALRGVDWAAWAERGKLVLGFLAKFIELVGGVDKAAMVLAGIKFAAPLATMASTLVGLIGTVGKLAAAFGLFTPVGAVLAGLAVAAYLIYQNWDKIGPVVTATWEAITTGVGAAIDAVKGFASGVTDWLAGALDAVAGWGTRLGAAFSAVWAEVAGLFADVGRVLVGKLGDFLEPVLAPVVEWGKRLVAVFAEIWTEVKGAIGGALGGIGDALGPALAPLQASAERAWSGIKAVFQAGWEGVRAVIDLLAGALGNLVGLFDRVVGLAERGLRGITAVIHGVRETIPESTAAAEAAAAAAAQREEEKAALKAQRTTERAAAGLPGGIAAPGPAARGPGPWLPEVAPPPGGAPGASGQVDVVIKADNQPPGTRVAAKATGAGVRTRTDVGYSMPQLQPGGA
jgi:phage-related protein